MQPRAFFLLSLTNFFCSICGDSALIGLRFANLLFLCQGNESSEFLSLFPRLFILSGGVASGFNHVQPETYQPRLLHVKGTSKTVRASQVALTRDSLNDGDTFVLDAGLSIWCVANFLHIFACLGSVSDSGRCLVAF